MKIPKALSYSALTLWVRDRDEFYAKYLSDRAAPRQPQTPPMAVGSSFDAYVKSALNTDLGTMTPQFEFQTIFEAQVEPQCRDFALTAGKVVFDAYKHTGAYNDLRKLLQESVEPPRFEFTVNGIVGGAPFTGKPDCRFILDRGQGYISCVFDFKVHGYCSKSAASPAKGYMICLDGFSGKQSRSHGKEHPGFLAMNFRGLTINSGYMEFCSQEYADQLSIYGWLLGEKVGDENVVLGIEEMCAKPGDPPTLRYARHRGRVKESYQLALEKKVADCWEAINSDHIFRDMSLEDSKARCEVLDEMAAGLGSDGTALNDWFNTVTRPTLW
jgi:hypothetical protein